MNVFIRQGNSINCYSYSCIYMPGYKQVDQPVACACYLSAIWQIVLIMQFERKLKRDAAKEKERKSKQSRECASERERERGGK